jgi:hypothetical protein
MNRRVPPPFPHALGLLVRYWACNMTLVHDQGGVWPGFGYSLGEQAALRAIARRVPAIEFGVWITFVAVFALLCFGGLTVAAFWLLAHSSEGHSPDSVSATAFMLYLGVAMVTCLALGFPAAMLAGSVLTGRLFDVAEVDLPDPLVRDHYVQKLSFQLLRAAFLASVTTVVICLWLPDRLWLLTRCVAPVLGPAVGLALAWYYRVRIHDPGESAGDESAAAKTRASPSSNR